MSEIIKNKYLDFGGLKKYDELIKGLIASGHKELADAIAALDAKLGSLEFEGSDDKSFAEVINELYSAIVELGAKDTELEGKINSIIGDLESLEGSTLADINAKLSEHTTDIAQHTTDIAGVKERVTAVEEAIKNLGEIEGGESLGEIVSEVKANTAALNSLKGDAETVTAAVNKIAKDAADAAQGAAEATAAADATSKADAALASAKEYADGLVKDEEGKSLFDAAGSAAAAETAAKEYADSLAANYDAAGAAAQALADAKADAAEKYQVKGDYEVAGTAANLDAAMDARVKFLEAIDHEQLAADAVAAVVAGAESDFDTLKEVADWIASDKEGSAALQTTVSGHTESINTINGDIDALEAKVDEDIANLTTHMSEAATALAEVDGRLDALEAFEETHASIEVSEIEGLFA
jgi:thiamine pyrophosphokinase